MLQTLPNIDDDTNIDDDINNKHKELHLFFLAVNLPSAAANSRQIERQAKPGCSCQT